MGIKRSLNLKHFIQVLEEYYADTEVAKRTFPVCPRALYRSGKGKSSEEVEQENTPSRGSFRSAITERNDFLTTEIC
ncbi:hypothetical protein NPIL_288481 [Nephila pilipes]|uniref:Uncharacterized protein n=1 Tax=Nephila pilipes TaxID=299642 RepID=A0A8X6P855_NEPPI|nr:hypothetical protein NPIL_288481 [Nephila pilipes]